MIKIQLPESNELFDFVKIAKLVKYSKENKDLKFFNKLLSIENDNTTNKAAFAPVLKALYYSILGEENKSILTNMIYQVLGKKYDLNPPLHNKCYHNNKETLVEASREENISIQFITDTCSIAPQNLNTIPHKLHNVWITNTARSMEDQKTQYLKNHAYLKNNIEKTSDWEHIVWLINPTSTTIDLANTITNNGYTIKYISDLAINPQSSYLINSATVFAEFGLYALSSNILRFVVLREEGGVYIDGDYEIFHELNSLVDNFSSISGFQAPGVTCSAFMAGEPHHSLFEAGYDILIRNIDLQGPDYTKYPCVRNDKMSLLTDVALSFVYFINEKLDAKKDLHFSPGIISPLLTNVNGNIVEITDFDPYTTCTNNSYVSSYIGIIGSHHASNSWGGDMAINLNHNNIAELQAW